MVLNVTLQTPSLILKEMDQWVFAQSKSCTTWWADRPLSAQSTCCLTASLYSLQHEMTTTRELKSIKEISNKSLHFYGKNIHIYNSDNRGLECLFSAVFCEGGVIFSTGVHLISDWSFKVRQNNWKGFQTDYTHHNKESLLQHYFTYTLEMLQTKKAPESSVSNNLLLNSSDTAWVYPLNHHTRYS